MKCGRCGAECANDDTFCPYCGSKLEKEEVHEEHVEEVKVEGQPQPRKRPIKGKGFGFLLGFFGWIPGMIVALILGDESCRKTAVIWAIVSSVMIIIDFILSIVFYGYFIHVLEEILGSGGSIYY